jgi:hypothetical protein
MVKTKKPRAGRVADVVDRDLPSKREVEFKP